MHQLMAAPSTQCWRDTGHPAWGPSKLAHPSPHLSRTNHDNLHVRGYKEEGTTTTPFDMTVLNDLDRFHLASDVIDRVQRLRNAAGHVKQFLRTS